MLSLRNTNRIRGVLGEASRAEALPETLRETASKLLGEDVVPWRTLRDICEAMREKHIFGSERQTGPWLNEVCAGSGPDLKSPKPREKSPELLARLEELQRKVDEKDYRRMVGPSAEAEHAAKEEVSLLPTFRLQISFGAQVILTMAVFYILGTYAGRAVSDDPVIQALSGVVGFSLGLILETFLWMLLSREGRSENYKKFRIPPRAQPAQTPSDKKNQ
ncbi:hypothetical protein BSKO_00862 [Bryopsis sp. KO-2023]|nr:hypothetical protein BSKO_00862 [Bryopsis sp. KO-2023]